MYNNVGVIGIGVNDNIQTFYSMKLVTTILWQCLYIILVNKNKIGNNAISLYYKFIYYGKTLTREVYDDVRV